MTTLHDFFVTTLEFVVCTKDLHAVLQNSASEGQLQFFEIPTQFLVTKYTLKGSRSKHVFHEHSLNKPSMPTLCFIPFFSHELPLHIPSESSATDST